MFASRRDQENAIHAQQTAAVTKANGAKALMPKTPLRQVTKTPFRTRQHNENAVSIKKGDGKVKEVVAAFEGRVTKASASFCTPAEPRTRAPLGAKTGNAKSTAFQTPAQHLTLQRPVTKVSSPRLRKSKFLVHDAKAEVEQPIQEEREIEIMHPREVPLPDYPDDDLWPHDRLYPQLEGANFTKGWAQHFLVDDDETSDYESKMKQFEKVEAVKKAKQQEKMAISTRVPVPVPGTITSVKAASALSGVRGIASFASATSSSAARSKATSTAVIKIQAKPSSKNNSRHAVAKTASNTTLGYAGGRRVSANGQRPLAIPKDDGAPLTLEERNDVLSAMWRYDDVHDNSIDELLAPTIDLLEIEELRDFEFEVPDD